MAVLGCLGDVIFQTSRDYVLTPYNMNWKSAAKYAEHARHLQDPKLEFTGLEADEMPLNIRLSRNLGVDPMEQIVILFGYERNGILLPLVLGDHAYGRYKWVITSTNRKLETFDARGNILTADLSLSLKGYTL